MSHRIIILDKTKCVGGALADIVSEVSRADEIAHEHDQTAINTKIDQISDLLSDTCSDLQGLVSDLQTLLNGQ